MISTTLKKAGLILFYSVAALANPPEIFNVPPFTENGVSEAITKKDLARETMIQMDPFFAVIPKGWSFMAAGVSEKMSASLTATPSEDLKNDETFIGINERKAEPLLTLEARAAKYKKEKKDWKLHFDTWMGTKWLVAEYSQVDKTLKKPMNHWAAFAILRGKEYWILAATPTTHFNKYSKVISDIIHSVEFRGDGVAAASPSKNTASSSTKPSVTSKTTGQSTKAKPVTNDKRLQDNWKIVSFKLDDGIALWSDSEAKSLIGQSISFNENQVQINDCLCESKAQAVEDKDLEKSLLRDLGAPCGEVAPGGPVFSVNRKQCSKNTNFPPYVTFESQDDLVVFGDAIAFCLKRKK